MTFPPCFPLPSQAFFSPLSVSPTPSSSEVALKPRLEPQDEDCAHLLLGMSRIVAKELEQKEGEAHEAASETSSLEDSCSEESSSAALYLKSALSNEESAATRVARTTDNTAPTPRSVQSS